MKIKTVKKLNIGLVVILLSISSGLGAVALFVQWENGGFDKTSLAGKANEYIFGGKEKVESETVTTSTGDEDINDGNKRVTLSEALHQTNMTEEVSSPSTGSEKFSFVAIGDAESNKGNDGFNGEFVDVLQKSRKYNPDFALFTGGIISASGTDDDDNRNRIDNLKTTVQQSYNNYYFAFGKQDIECGTTCIDHWLEIFFGVRKENEQKRILYHSFDYLNTHFVLLSTDYPKKHSIDEEQLQWLADDLSQNTKPNTIVVQHISPVTFFKESAKACRDMSCDDQVRQKLLALFKKHNVDLVISGHENAFDHKIVDGIDFVLSGQIGNKPRHKNVIKGDIYTLFMVRGEEIKLEAINTKGEIIRAISIK